MLLQILAAVAMENKQLHFLPGCDPSLVVCSSLHFTDMTVLYFSKQEFHLPEPNFSDAAMETSTHISVSSWVTCPCMRHVCCNGFSNIVIYNSN